MSYEDRKRLHWNNWESDEADKSIARRSVSPGKRTLTMSLPSLPASPLASMQEPVQQKADPAAEIQRKQQAAFTERWMDVALRPDLHDAPVQRKSEEEERDQAPPVLPVSSGQPLPAEVQAKMEGAFGTDLSAVRVHEGPQATAMGALAYTQGTDIHFAPGQYQPSSQSGQELLGHELTHVLQQSQGRVQAVTQAKDAEISDDAALEREADEMGARAARGEGSGEPAPRPSKTSLTATAGAGQRIMRAPGPLNAAQEAAAVAFNRGRFDGRSVRAIQIATGTRVDGDFGEVSAQGLATWQGTHGLTVNGRVDAATLNALVLDLAAAGDHELAIQLVVDFHNLDITSDTLTVSYDAGLATAHNTRFDSGNLRVITVGPTAFAGANALRDAIRAALGDAAPAAAPAGAALNRLTRPQQQSAMGFLRTYGDRRSILAIQGLVGDDVSGTVDVDLVQRIADYQSTKGLAIDGKVGHDTLRAMVTDLTATGGHNAAIRLVIDFHDLSHQWALLDIRYDPAVGANASTGGHLPGPSTVRVGPSGFAQGYEGLVHTIAHELEHVRQRRIGMPNRNEREFRGEELEMLSEGMLEEDINGFMDDAGRALRNWNALPPVDQRRLWWRFARARRKVRQRFDAASPAEQVTHRATMAAYDAVVRP